MSTAIFVVGFDARFIGDSTGRGKGLFTCKPLRESETVLELSVLWFFSLDRLMDCLRSGENSYFADSVAWPNARNGNATALSSHPVMYIQCSGQPR